MASFGVGLRRARAAIGGFLYSHPYEAAQRGKEETRRSCSPRNCAPTKNHATAIPRARGGATGAANGKSREGNQQHSGCPRKTVPAEPNLYGQDVCILSKEMGQTSESRAGLR